MISNIKCDFAMTDNRLTNEEVDFTPKRSFLAPIHDEIKEKAVDDPFARFLLGGWKQVAVLVLAVLAIVYLRNAWVRTQDLGVRAAADVYSQVRQEFSELKRLSSIVPSAEEKAKNDEAIKRVKETINHTLLALSESQKPYGQLASVYQAVSAELEGNDVAVKEALKANAEPTLGADEKGLPRLNHELGLLVSARASLDKPEFFSEGRRTLKMLSENGQFVNVSAAVTLARIASNPEEKSEAISVLQSILNNQPEEDKIIEPELKRLQG